MDAMKLDEYYADFLHVLTSPLVGERELVGNTPSEKLKRFQENDFSVAELTVMDQLINSYMNSHKSFSKIYKTHMHLLSSDLIMQEAVKRFCALYIRELIYPMIFKGTDVVNMHYVPLCYMKNFRHSTTGSRNSTKVAKTTKNSEDNSIITPHMQFVRKTSSTPIYTQEVEHFFSKIEGEYSNVMSLFTEDNKKVTEEFDMRSEVSLTLFAIITIIRQNQEKSMSNSTLNMSDLFDYVSEFFGNNYDYVGLISTNVYHLPMYRNAYGDVENIINAQKEDVAVQVVPMGISLALIMSTSAITHKNRKTILNSYMKSVIKSQNNGTSIFGVSNEDMYENLLHTDTRNYANEIRELNAIRKQQKAAQMREESKIAREEANKKKQEELQKKINKEKKERQKNKEIKSIPKPNPSQTLVMATPSHVAKVIEEKKENLVKEDSVKEFEESIHAILQNAAKDVFKLSKHKLTNRRFFKKVQ